MNRARADILGLVNWKGVFYEQFKLDRHVTALEGANGAGKTTVMIAAYVVLLPDMSRLRFTNLGETGATGGDKGIWGRLGEMGRPSYAVIDFALSGARRLIAGVHLERKGEPSVEPTPFLVSGLDSTVRLQDLLLLARGDEELVPELPELRENAARLGGRLQVFGSARDYFAALFDQGVTPLRLGTDEERNKLNEMLRTSMTGGISRALTSELRSFLLKEEGGLADTLQRMKANLDACRRTRTEVDEARRLEREIGGVYEAGQAMFTAAVLATRERAEELSRKVAEAESASAAAREGFFAAEETLGTVLREIETAEEDRAEAQSSLERRRDWLRRLEAALATAREIARVREDLERASETTRVADGARRAAEQARDARRGERRRCEEAHKRAAAGLGDLQKGLEELHRRAGAHAQAVRRLAEARVLLQEPALDAGRLAERLTVSRTRIEVVDRERREAARRLDDAAAHRKEHAEALAALSVLLNEPAASDSAYSSARQALQRLRDLRALGDRAPVLAAELASAQQLAARQAKAQGRARALGVVITEGAAVDRVRALLEEQEQKQRTLAEELRSAQIGLAEAERAGEAAKARARDLVEREPIWQGLMDRARRASEALGLDIIDRETLNAARVELAERLTAAKHREEELSRHREHLASHARELLAAGGPFEPDLLRLRDELSAQLYAARFEDVGLDEAGAIEASLGPLAQALVVEDPAVAARLVGERPPSLASVWLVAGDAEIVPASRALGATATRDVIVNEGPAVRVSRIPDHPRLGRKAREKRAAELRAEADAHAVELEAQRGTRRSLERLREDMDAMLEGCGVWLAGDPAPQLADARREVADAAAAARSHREATARSDEMARILRKRMDDLRVLLGEAFLLDPPDHASIAAQLAEEHAAALAAQAEVARCAQAVDALEEKLDVLRRRPLSSTEIEGLEVGLTRLHAERDRLYTAIDAMEYVADNRRALAWGDAREKLDREQGLVPALQGQLEEAEQAVEAAASAVQVAEDEWIKATTAWQDADGRRLALAGELHRAEQRLVDSGIPKPTPDDVEEVRNDVERLDAEIRELQGRLDALRIQSGERRAAREQALQKLRDAEEKLTSAQNEAAPAVERWDQLRAAAQAHNVLSIALAARSVDAAGGRASMNLWQEAARQKAVLVERLRAARGGDGVLAEEGSSPVQEASGEAYLRTWLVVREWLRRRVPAQVAEVDEPLEALHRLRDHLATLSERLAGQEADLRGASEDVARGIDVQIRKARGQVNRLNKNLDGVRFGSIRAIRVRLQPVERMEQVLRALREGAAQTLLFQAELPIEEALNVIFERYGGGRTGGQRLLDYREYIHLQVEVRRTSGADWEIANPTRVSTGEAIGIGAALMMVVLTEWERDANLLRAKKSSGSLRFLFLDEANRLSKDNLGVLFDLCESLDLQLLIAAPEVAHAGGNTAYRLVRHVTPEGREEVLVSGRRMVAEA